MAADAIMMKFTGAQILRETPGILRSLLATATPEDLDWQPSPERWSISMVLAHLADVERKGFEGRFRAMAEQDNPYLPAYDQLELFRSRCTFDGLTELTAFERERRKMLAWLETMPASVGSRTANHEELGIISFHQLLNEFAFHDLGHIRQVIELYRSHAFYPNMGAFQGYYTINP